MNSAAAISSSRRNISSPPAFKPGTPPTPQYYPRPGKKNVSVRLGVIPLEGGKTVWVEWDRKKYEYLAAVAWDKTGGLTVQLQDRAQQFLALRRVESGTGTTTVLLEETHPTWLNLNKGMPKWLDKNRFLWISDRGGNSQLHMVDMQATGDDRVRAVSPPGVPVSEWVELLEDEQSRPSPVVQGGESPTSMQPWRHSVRSWGQSCSQC